MSGECEKCGNHTLECICDRRNPLLQKGWMKRIIDFLKKPIIREPKIYEFNELEEMKNEELLKLLRGYISVSTGQRIIIILLERLKNAMDKR